MSRVLESELSLLRSQGVPVRNKICVAIGGLSILFASMQGVRAQGFQRPLFDPPEATDRPTQRWLPLPQGDEVDLNSQAKLLQQLQELMSTESGDSQLPQLSDEQLQQMENTLEDLRRKFGSDKLPNLEDIPPEWINEALGDPLVRKQAQQLLEKYARDRKLPSAAGDPERSSRDGAPFPSAQPKSNPEPKSKNQDGADQRKLPADPSRQGEHTDAPENSEAVDGASKSSPLPQVPDAERLDALKQLFEKLKKIEGDRVNENSNAMRSQGSNARQLGGSTPDVSKLGSSNPGQRPAPRPQTSNSPREPSSSNGLRSRSQPAPPNNLSNDQPNNLNRAPSLEPKAIDDSEQADVAAPKSADGGEDLDAMPSELNPNNPLLQSQKPDAMPSKGPRSSQSSPLSESLNRDLNASGTRSGNGPGLPPGRTTENGRSQGIPDHAGSSSRTTESTSSANKNSKTPEMDLKTQLERQGLGSALRSIVQKTLKEQGELNSKDAAAAKNGSKSTVNDGSSAAARARPADKIQSPSLDSKASSVSKSNTSKPSTANSSTASKPSQQGNASGENGVVASSMSGLRDLAAEVWGAIRTTPSEQSNQSSRSSSNDAVGGAGVSSNLGFNWQSMIWVICLLAFAALAVFFLLARKRIVMAASAREADAKVAKELLADGIRTRADVVRAFHRFVLRHSQPVAMWWNHRYVATRISEASPQLTQVIMDLTSVYEQARYLPPQFELSSEELHRVRAALSQCAATGT